MTGRTKLLIGCAVLVALVAAAVLLPLPSPARLRDLATGAGAVTPVLFLLGYAVLAVAPLPRTVLNLAAGLLLGNAAGIGIALTATTIAGGLAFWLARTLGSEFVARHAHRAVVRQVNDRLTGRHSVLAVTSLRLIPVIPFAPLSYCCGLLAVKPVPYLLGTALGSVPGTVAVVVLGDALTGGTPPALLACYGAFAAAGLAGLAMAARRSAPQRAVTAGNPERNHI